MELFTPGHLIVLVIVALVLFFGWKQLPDMARSLGRSLRIFKTEIKGMTQDDKERAKADEPVAEKPRALPAAEIIPNDIAKSRPRPTPNGEAARTEAARTEAPRAEAQ
jgi:sec-independent protein translocase protein TatA